MRTTQAIAADTALAVDQSISFSHPDDVMEVRAESGLRIFARFCDGTEGVVEMSALVNSPGAGVFATLKDPGVFAQVGLELGAVSWPGGIDLAPDLMYAAFRKDRKWIPGYSNDGPPDGIDP